MSAYVTYQSIDSLLSKVTAWYSDFRGSPPLPRKGPPANDPVFTCAAFHYWNWQLAKRRDSRIERDFVAYLARKVGDSEDDYVRSTLTDLLSRKVEAV